MIGEKWETISSKFGEERVERFKVFGGWIIRVTDTSFKYEKNTQRQLVFVPDVKHEWSNQ